MICAYCGKEAKSTKEHIISSGILDLFPECFATIDGNRNVIHTADPMVKDVCADCNNNQITYIDAYAKDIIKRYFVSKYEKDSTLEFRYDYTLLQKMCLKYAFNDLRANKRDFSFFDSPIVSFLRNASQTKPLRNITLLAGLAINTSPVPDFLFGNNKIQWDSNPIFFSSSIIENINYDTGALTIRENNLPENLEGLSVSYVFRFNSLQLLLLCWEKSISDDQLSRNLTVLKYKYPYELLNDSGCSVLSRCTSEITYYHPKLIDVTWGQGMADTVSWMRGTFSAETQSHLKSVEAIWKKEEQRLAKEHPRK